MADHAIYIRPEPFGCGYDIVIEPPILHARYNAERGTVKAARRYADSIRIVTGFKVVDETGEPR
ncbi:MAG: hypothetical protein JOY99_12865 [Sphingomonadaceae bacterium]|nr:hypothetical protein [Sphingomonadaceae bacterium]